MPAEQKRRPVPLVGEQDAASFRPTVGVFKFWYMRIHIILLKDTQAGGWAVWKK